MHATARGEIINGAGQDQEVDGPEKEERSGGSQRRRESRQGRSQKAYRGVQHEALVGFRHAAKIDAGCDQRREYQHVEHRNNEKNSRLEIQRSAAITRRFDRQAYANNHHRDRQHRPGHPKPAMELPSIRCDERRLDHEQQDP